MGEQETDPTQPPGYEAEPEPQPIPAEDIELDVGWDEKGLDGLPVEDTAEPTDWLEEGDIAVRT